MIRLFFILIFLIGLLSHSQSKTCVDFKNGTFTYSDQKYSELVTTRTDSVQIDTYPKWGYEITSTIMWLSDCKNIMESVEVNNPKMEALIGNKFVIEIIEINGNKILYRSESEGFTVTKEMIKSD